MYRSGISSAFLRTLDKDEGKEAGASRKLQKALRTAHSDTVDASEHVPWRSLALALTDDNSSSGSVAAKGAGPALATKPPIVRPATAGLQASRLLLGSSSRPTSSNRHRFKQWLESEGVAVAGDGDCKTMKFASEYYSTLARVIEQQARMLPLTSDQVLIGIQLVWAQAPSVSRCLLAALQLEAACKSQPLQSLSRESCVEVIACCFKWAEYVQKNDPRAPTSELRRAIVAVCDSIFRGLQPAVWQVARPLQHLRRTRLLDVAPTGSSQLNDTALAMHASRLSGDSANASLAQSSEGMGLGSTSEFASSVLSHGLQHDVRGTYVFHNDLLVKKKLSVDCAPTWLDGCSDEHVLDAACSCPTYFEVCNQFAKQEKQDRERCQITIAAIHKLQEKVAVLCREDDAAVRYAYAMDWQKSNLFRDVNKMRADFERLEGEFDASMDDMIRRQNERLKMIQEAKQHYQRLRNLQEHSQSFTPEELAVARGQFFQCVINSCAALSSALPMLGEVLQSVSAMIKERPDFHIEEFLSNFVNDRPETVMELPPREFLRRWAAWLAGKAGWRGDHLHLRIPEDLKVGDFYSWLHAAIKVLSSNDMFTPYLPKGESLKIGSSLVFVGERIMRDWSMKKAVFLAARIAAGDLDAAQSKEEDSDGSGGSSYTGSSGSWSSSGSGSGGETVDEGSENDSDDDNSDAQSSSHLSRGSTGRKSSHSGSSRHSQVTLGDDHSGSGSAVGSDDDESSGGSSSDISEDDAWSKTASNHSGGSSRGKVEISIGTRIKQQNQVRRVLGDEDALAADLAEMEEESRLNMIRERREALKQKLLAAKQKKQDKKKGSKKGKKSKKREEKKKDSKVSFQEGEDKGKNGKGKNEKGKGKKKKKRRKRKQRLKVNTDETDEQRELRQLLMVRDAIIKNNKPLREGSERIYKTMKMAAAAVLTGIRSYRSTMGFFFKFKPPKELEESATPKERMATVVDLFRQYLPAGFLVDFDLDCGAPEPHYALLGALFVCHPCMHAMPEPKQDRKMRTKNVSTMSMPAKERLYFAQVTLSGLQFVLQELVAAQPPHLVAGLTDDQIDGHIRSWLNRCSNSWSQISVITRDLFEMAQKERKRLALWEQLQSRVQKMRAEFNMQRMRVAWLEVQRQKNSEKEQAAFQKKNELAEALAFQKEAAKSKEGRRALAKLSHVTVARFEDIFRENDDVDLDDFDDNDDEESQEQKSLDKAKKIKNRMLEKQVEMNLCMNLLLQRFVTIERVFAYYCRCIKVLPAFFRFRESIGPREFAVFCQECELTGDVKGRLTIIEARRIFKTANMEGDEGDMSGDTDLEIEEFFELLIRLAWAIYGPRGVAAQSILPKRLTMSEALVELLDHHSVLRLALQEDRLIFLNLVQDPEVQSTLEQHEQGLMKLWKSNQERRKAADGEELKGLTSVQWARLLENSDALALHLTEEMCTSIFEMVQDTGDDDDDDDDDAPEAEGDEEEEDAIAAADNARMDFDEFKVGLCAAAMCKYPDPHQHLADKIDHLITFNLLRG